MTSIVDSVAHFNKRCDAVGMSDRAITHLNDSNMNTLGKIAFAVGQPGQPLDPGEFNIFAQNTLISQADTAVLKRMVFEGHTQGTTTRTCD